MIKHILISVILYLNVSNLFSQNGLMTVNNNLVWVRAAGDTVNLVPSTGGMPYQSGQSGKVLSTNGIAYQWVVNSASVNWGGIQGTLSNQTDLNNALNAKAAIASPAFTGTPTGIGLPVYARVTGSNVTTTGQSLVDITGLSIALIANAVYEFEAVLSASTTAVTTGTGYGVQYSAAGATIEAQITGSSTATATKTLRINALNTSSQAWLTSSAQTGGILIKGIVTTGANAGNLTIQHLKVTSGTSTIFINSFLRATRIL